MRKPIKRRPEVDEVQDFYETLLRAGPFPEHGASDAEVTCNAVLHQIKEYRAGRGGNELDAELMLPELLTAVINMVHGGRDPSRVPYHYIRHALDNPLSLQVRKYRGEWITEPVSFDVPNKLREGIKGPLRAIRVKCTICQGGSTDLIKICPSVNCFIWPFRMDGNPFYGRLVESTGDEDGFEGDDVSAQTDAEFEAEEAARIAAQERK